LTGAYGAVARKSCSAATTCAPSPIADPTRLVEPDRTSLMAKMPRRLVSSRRVPPAAGTLEAVDEHTCVLHTGATSLDTLSVYLALIGFDFEVREPKELVDRIRWLAERFSRATSGQRQA